MRVTHFYSNDFIKKCDVSVLLGPSSGDYIKVCRNKSTSELVQFSVIPILFITITTLMIIVVALVAMVVFVCLS